MNKIVIALAIAAMTTLSACSTKKLPTVSAPFPDAPTTEQCPELVRASAADWNTTVIENYGRYAECAKLNASWIGWHRTQKDLYDRVNNTAATK